MRALLLEALDGPDSLRLTDVPPPRADDNRVVLEVRAVGINFPDLLSTKGQYQNRVALPFVPGCEIAGVIGEAPEGCGWRPGDRAAAFVWDGGYAEQALVPVASLTALPDDADFETGAGMIVNYHTAHFALSRRGGVVSGESVLVLGAAGGIGTASVQVAKGLGARVIAGVAGEGQRPTALAAGADDVVILAEGFSEEVRTLVDSRGVDVVLDPLGDWLFVEATRALAPEGRILVVGFAAGDIPTLRINRLLLKNISAVGVAWGAFLEVDPEIMAHAAGALSQMYTAGIVRPHITERYRFEEIPAALRRLEAQQIRGKAVASVNTTAGSDVLR
jgi:NADPH:quinone reductase